MGKFTWRVPADFAVEKEFLEPTTIETRLLPHNVRILNRVRSFIILMLEYGNGQLTETIGFLAAILTTTAFVPQFIKVWKTRSTRDISMRMYLMLCSGVFLWLIYGIRLRSLPIILANGVTLALTFAILGLKIRHK